MARSFTTFTGSPTTDEPACRFTRRNFRTPEVHGKAGITFGRQIGAYPILVGVEYKIPLETQSSVMITGHGARSITGVEVGLDPLTVSEKQLEAMPGIGKKSAWSLVSSRGPAQRKSKEQLLQPTLS